MTANALISTDSALVSSAGQRYLEIVAPVNEVVSKFNSAKDDATRLRSIGEMAMVFASVVERIQGADWPPEVSDVVGAVGSAASSASAAALGLLADISEEAAADFATRMSAVASASADLRQALGVPRGD